ncbi:MAG: DNRLRE domain-containing protein [Burkholderiaceae bacterium]
MKVIYLILGSFVIPFLSVGQTTLTLTASKDAAIGYHDGASTANNNYGYAAQNAAYTIPSVAQSGGLNINRALIDFNLGAIPSNATIISASLNLYALGASGSLPGHSGPNNSAYLERITQSWGENTVTWNNQPTSTAVNHVTLGQSTSATQNYLNINVTNLVQDMVNSSSTSFGFKLKLVTEAVTNSLLFASKDNSNTSLTPKLVVTYSTGCVKTDTLPADYDAAIGYHDGASTANNNYGTAAQSAAYTIPAVAQPGGLNINRALMHFNLSTIPSNATITDAKLDLYAYGTIGSYPGHYGSANNALIERVTSNWSENTVTWNTQPTSTSVNQVPLAGTTNATLDYLNINVTSIVQDIIASTSNNGIILKLATEAATNLLPFCSKDHFNSAKHPKLRVTYSCNFQSVAELQNTISSINCFPNPATNTINFSINTSKSGNGKITIYDAQGKLVNETVISNNISTNNYIINTSLFSKGIYNYSILFEGEQKSGKFIIE